MNKNKKLLFIINVDWYFCLHWMARAKAAKNAGYDVHIATHITDSENKENLENQGYKVHAIGLRRKSMGFFNNIATFKEIASILKNLSPDLVHSITVKPNLFAGLICKWRGMSQIMSVTGLGLTFSSQTLKAKASRFVVSSLYRTSSRHRDNLQIIFENPDDMATFQAEKIADTEQMQVIAGAGVDLEEYKFTPLPPKQASINILFAARMLWDKGLPTLIDAVTQLTKKGYCITLSVAGILDSDSQNAIPLEQIEKWEQAGDIKWLGQVSDMVGLIKTSDIVCLPTQYGEGVPRILIESAAIGRPIVTTNVAGCRDIVADRQTGFLVPIKNSPQLAHCLEKLVESEELRKKFGQKARLKVEQTFCQNIVIKKTLEAYELIS